MNVYDFRLLWPLITSFSDFLGNFWTYRNFPELLLHLVQFFLLAGSREQSGGIATLHSIDLNGRLEGQTVDIAWSTCKQAVSWHQWAVKKYIYIYYLDQLCCRSDHRRAELADLMSEREREKCMLWKQQKSWRAQMKLWLTVHLTFNQASMSAKRISSHSSALARLN